MSAYVVYGCPLHVFIRLSWFFALEYFNLGNNTKLCFLMLLKCTAFTSLEINKILFQEEKFESELLEVGEFLTNVNRNYFSSSPEKKKSPEGENCVKWGMKKQWIDHFSSLRWTNSHYSYFFLFRVWCKKLAIFKISTVHLHCL